MEEDYGPLASFLGAGVVPAFFVVGGIMYGPMVRLTVTRGGIRVANPLRTAAIPWADFIGVRVGVFGLRLKTDQFEFPVFAAQSNNWEEFRNPAHRDLEKLAATLLQVRDQILDSAQTSGERASGAGVSVRRWRSPWPAVMAVSAYSLMVGIYVYLW
ncbi:PH domain-containing protein [Blastococcus sp. LR1]|uniref:PH domain-containing protein n=1 Tax=Blastococcus sp. LR1 TaxID=2877000 RepID=UPI001CCD8D55|nr:PH domain-containing protein [Blastococcus sp. LR1]MCA0146259.1 PH domain-containing protein [Blastococcus sp. LR1]